jgi:hypothetical protein
MFGSAEATGLWPRLKQQTKFTVILQLVWRYLSKRFTYNTNTLYRDATWGHQRPSSQQAAPAWAYAGVVNLHLNVIRKPKYTGLNVAGQVQRGTKVTQPIPDTRSIFQNENKLHWNQKTKGSVILRVVNVQRVHCCIYSHCSSCPMQADEFL